MSIKPIDLQVNFSQMNHVSRDQAAVKSNELHKELIAGQEISKESVDSDSKVLKNEKSSDGPEDIRDEKEKHSKSSDSEKKDSENDKLKKSSDEIRDDLFDDPSLGKNIDLSC